MKRLPTAFGAGVLSAAVVVSGLAFGPAAAQAAYVAPGAPVTASAPAAQGQRMLGKLILADTVNGTTTYTTVRWQGDRSFPDTKGFATLAEATAWGDTMNMPAIGSTGGISFAAHPSACITPGSTPGGVGDFLLAVNSTCDVNAVTGRLSFAWQRTTNNRGQTGWVLTTPSNGIFLKGSGDGIESVRPASSADMVVIDTAYGFTGSLKSKDDGARSATVSGTAIPGATISRGSQTVTADQTTGAWSMTVTGLTVGSNSIVFVEKDGSRVTGRSVTVPVTIASVPVSPNISVTFPATQVGSTSDWARLDVLTSAAQGAATMTAPTGTTFADLRIVGGGGTITFNASRTVATLKGVGEGGDNMFWGTDGNRVEFKLAIPASITPGTIGGGRFLAQRAPSYGGAVTVDKPFSVTVTNATVNSNTGVYELAARPSAGSAFRPGTTGTIGWQYAPASGARGMTIRTGQSFVYTTTLPKGLNPQGLVNDTIDGIYARTWAVTKNADGSTKVTMTITNTGPDVVNRWVSREGLSVGVAADSTLVQGATVRVDFTPAPGNANPVPTQTAQVPVAQAETFTAAGRFDGTNVAHISGQATPNATVTLWEIDAPTRTTQATANGTYDFAIPATRDGLRYFSAAQNVGTPNQSPIIPVPLNYGSVEQVHITAPGNGAQLKPEVTTFTGWGAANAHVVVRNESNDVVAQTDTNAAGQWSVPSAAALTSGEHTFTATQTGFGGVTSTANVHVTVLPAQSPFTAAGRIDGNGPAHISGAATPGATVTLWELDAPTRTTQATAQGTYDFEIPATRDGLRYFTAAQNVGTPNQSDIIPVPLNYGTIAPVQITAPGNSAQIQPGVTTFTGRGAPGGHVVVRDESNAVVLETDVDATGAWSAPSTALASGQHTYTATQTGRGGVTSSANVQVTVLPAQAPFTAQGRFDGNNEAHVFGKATPGATVTLWEIDRPQRTTIAGTDGAYDFSIPATRDGLRYFTAAQNVGQPNQSEIIPVPLQYGSVAPVQITAPGNGAQLKPEVTTFTGRGSVGAHVVVRDESSAVVATTDVDGTGQWVQASSGALSSGQHTYTATQTGFGGVTSVASVQVTVAPSSPFTAQGRFNGNELAHIYGNVTPGASVVIYEIDAKPVVIPGSQTQDGTYDYAVPATTGGVRYFTAAERVPGAPESSPVAVPLNYGITIPVAMTVPDQANTGFVTLSGRGAPGAQITVKDGSTTVLSMQSDGAGGWYKDTDVALQPGDRTLTVTQTSKGGVVSTDTKTLYVTPLTGTFRQDADGSWHIAGNATPNAQVKLYELGRGVMEQTATAQGTYDFTIPAPYVGYRYFTPTETTPGHGESYPIAMPKNFG